MKSYFPMSGKKNARIEKLNKFWGGHKISIMRMNQAFGTSLLAIGDKSIITRKKTNFCV